MKSIRFAPSFTVLVHIAVIVAGYFLPPDSGFIAAAAEPAPLHQAARTA